MMAPLGTRDQRNKRGTNFQSFEQSRKVQTIFIKIIKKKKHIVET